MTLRSFAGLQKASAKSPSSTNVCLLERGWTILPSLVPVREVARGLVQEGLGEVAVVVVEAVEEDVAEVVVVESEGQGALWHRWINFVSA